MSASIEFAATVEETKEVDWLLSNSHGTQYHSQPATKPRLRFDIFPLFTLTPTRSSFASLPEQILTSYASIKMSGRANSRSSSIYSQDSGRGARGANTSFGAPVRTSSPEPMDYSRTSGGPPPPGHASLMSAYGHSNYGGSNRSSGASDRGAPSARTRNTDSLGTFIDSRPQSQAAQGPPSSVASARTRNTDSLNTFIDSRPQSRVVQGPPSSIASGLPPPVSARPLSSSGSSGAGNRSRWSPDTPSVASSRPPVPPARQGSAGTASFAAFVGGLPPTERNMVADAGDNSQEARRRARQRDRRY